MWIKQHLRIKRFFGTSENAVKSQLWVAVSVYVLVATIRKSRNRDPTLRDTPDPVGHRLNKSRSKVLTKSEYYRPLRINAETRHAGKS